MHHRPRVNALIQRTTDPTVEGSYRTRQSSHVAPCGGSTFPTMVRTMNKSSHPGARWTTNRVYSLSREHSQEHTLGNELGTRSGLPQGRLVAHHEANRQCQEDCPLIEDRRRPVRRRQAGRQTGRQTGRRLPGQNQHPPFGRRGWRKRALPASSNRESLN